MRAIELAAIESGEVSGLTLMERAGQGVVEAVLDLWPGACPNAVVFCGPGNNGGDGYVIARRLSEMGWKVTVWAPLAPVTQDARTNARIWADIGKVTTQFDPAIAEGAIVIDALFGTGLARPIAEHFWRPISCAQSRGARIIAVDILSGLCSDTGQVRAEGAYLGRGADLTVSFQTLKPGHLLLPAGAMTGAVRVVDIGLGARVAVQRESEQVITAVTKPQPGTLSKQSGHKFNHGHTLILSGGVGKGGAARLAARAALRVGAGLVSIACPPSALIENAARLDAVMLRPVKDATALQQCLEDPRITACCIGPGLGLGTRESACIAAVLERGCPTVLDADALTLIARDPMLRALVHSGCVLTPHAGEFARIWPELSEEGSSKTHATSLAARDIGAVVLNKGVDTVIATPTGQLAVHAALRERAAPWLATAGAGDVLAGLIAGLLARGYGAMDAAAFAAWMHVECARDFGPGLIAEDLPERLPQVLKRLEQ